MKKNKILVVGSIAYDNLMRFEGLFQEKILPSALSSLSISFGVTPREVFYGGCGGNIAFHLKKLGEGPLLIALAGKDFKEYENWFLMNKINTDYLIRDLRSNTSAAFIATDFKGHQIALFDAGAAESYPREKHAKFQHIFNAEKEKVFFAIISPTNKDFMLNAIEECDKNAVPYFFDPGQTIHSFSRQELEHAIGRTHGLFVNEYEMQMLLKQVEMSREILEDKCTLIIETLGEKGSMISFKGKRISISAVKPASIEDPTGCGDAYRAAFLKHLKQILPKITLESLKKAGNFASQYAAKVAEKKGTQVEV